MGNATSSFRQSVRKIGRTLKFETKNDNPAAKREKQQSALAEIADMVKRQGEVIKKQGKVFEEFKASNDERLKEISTKGSSDPLTEEKTDKIADELAELSSLKDAVNNLKSKYDDVATKLNRPMAGGSNLTPEQVEYKTAFEDYVRKGRAGKLAELEEKSMAVDPPGSGGYAVPEELDRNILDLLRDVSPVRAEATVVTVGSGDWKKIVNIGGTTSGWVAEKAARPGTDSPQLAEIAPVVGEVYAAPATTQRALDDIFFDVAAFLENEVQDEFAKQEGIAFISGNGVDKPKGILATASSEDADGIRPFGTVQLIKSGKADGFADTNPDHALLDLVYSLKAGHRRQAKWFMNSMTIKEVMKFKDSDGAYIWQRSLQEGQPDRLLNHPIVPCEDMPDIAADSLPIAIGNWRRAYYILDRIGTRVMRDPYTNKPYVTFYATKRVGGGAVDTEAFKLLKVAA